MGQFIISTVVMASLLGVYVKTHQLAHFTCTLLYVHDTLLQLENIPIRQDEHLAQGLAHSKCSTKVVEAMIACLTSLNPFKTPWSRLQCPHFTDGEIEGQRGKDISP